MIWWVVGGGVGGYNDIHTRPLQQLPLVMSLPVLNIPYPTHATPVVRTFLKFSRWKDNLSTCLVHSVHDTLTGQLRLLFCPSSLLILVMILSLSSSGA